MLTRSSCASSRSGGSGSDLRFLTTDWRPQETRVGCNENYIVFHDTFNGDEFVSGEIVVDKGPHPDAESDFVLFCDVMTNALGLS